MSGRPAFSIPEETMVVALLARGDTVVEIQNEIEKSFNKEISAKSITRIKKRNHENLEIIRSRTQEKIERDQAAIRNKANIKLDKKLDSDDLAAQVITKAHSQYINGDIKFQDYERLLRAVRELSVSELVSISKEMHVQTSDVPDTPATSEDMAKLAEAIKTGDTLTLSQLVFKRGQPGTSPNAPLQPISVSEAQSANS